jgi:hypothetical protein
MYVILHRPANSCQQLPDAWFCASLEVNDMAHAINIDCHNWGLSANSSVNINLISIMKIVAATG